jgi:hypothetical protein
MMQKTFVIGFALLMFFVPAISHANVFSDIWDSYVFTLAGIGQTAAVVDAFPRDKYVDVKVNGSDGPVAVSNTGHSIIRWSPRSILLIRLLTDCRVTYPSTTGMVTKQASLKGSERAILNPAANGLSYVELYCKKGSREFRDTVQITLSSRTAESAASQRTQFGGGGSGGSGGGFVPRGTIPNIPSYGGTYQSVPIPGLPPGVGGSVITNPLPSGPTPEEQQIMQQIRLQAQ